METWPWPSSSTSTSRRFRSSETIFVCVCVAVVTAVIFAPGLVRVFRGGRQSSGLRRGRLLGLQSHVEPPGPAVSHPGYGKVSRGTLSLNPSPDAT